MVMHPLRTHGLGITIRKKIGKPYAYGLRRFGKYLYGQWQPMWGIYQHTHRNGKTYTRQLRHYKPPPSNTAPQAAQRAKFAAAVLEWQGLTDEQKSVYDEMAKGKHNSGYCLSLRAYLLSH